MTDFRFSRADVSYAFSHALESLMASEMPPANLPAFWPFQVKGKIKKTAKNKFGVNPYDDEEIGYYRVSTGRDQDPAYQIDLLKRRGIPEENIFGDIGSGVKKRKKFEFVLKMLAGRPGWTLVVWKIDRLGRDAAELLVLMKLFQTNNWNLVSLTEGVDTRTPMGRLCFGMMALIAQHERDVIIERTQAGMNRLKEQGIELGRETVITPAMFKDIERRLVKGTETIQAIAASYKLSTSAIHNHFPRWKGRSPSQRIAWRVEHPLPTQRSGVKHKARRRHPRRKRKTT